MVPGKVEGSWLGKPIRSNNDDEEDGMVLCSTVEGSCLDKPGRSNNDEKVGKEEDPKAGLGKPDSIETEEG